LGPECAESAAQVTMNKEARLKRRNPPSNLHLGVVGSDLEVPRFDQVLNIELDGVGEQDGPAYARLVLGLGMRDSIGEANRANVKILAGVRILLLSKKIDFVIYLREVT